MEEMFTNVKEGNVITPRFKEIKASQLNDDTVMCTLQDLIDLLGEKRGLYLYSVIKTFGRRK